MAIDVARLEQAGHEIMDQIVNIDLTNYQFDIDKLVEHIIFAPDRAAQITATRVLDRVLLAHHFVVPHWHIPTHRLAYWDNISRPSNLPLYSHGFPNIWWANEDNQQ